MAVFQEVLSVYVTYKVKDEKRWHAVDHRDDAAQGHKHDENSRNLGRRSLEVGPDANASQVDE